ncbi:helix-turn-helix transcriptional regulator [Providencia vermicola]|uniref:XRE family transcriptional regulator n=1 Tax=Providencia vermicola TaxID=333965 RepID=UPI0013A7A726|nr:S24 family peptidase [Providencia vermicola]QIC15719.1 helix-turn-helix transcriptional regulator [Providencia vermicola]
MNIGSRIRAIRMAKKITIAELADAIDSDPGNVSRLETGKQKSFTEQLLMKISSALSVSVIDLFSEELDYTVHKNSITESNEMRESIYRVELLDVNASAGPGCNQISEVVDVIHSIEYESEQAKLMFGSRLASTVKVINAKGDSMSGTIEPGDLIFVDISINHIDSDGIYVFSFDGNIHVKRLQVVPDKIMVLSDNPLYTNWEINPSNEHRLCIHGKVLISQTQAFRRHS